MAVVIVVHCEGHNMDAAARDTFVCSNHKVAQHWADRYKQSGWKTVWLSEQEVVTDILEEQDVAL